MEAKLEDLSVEYFRNILSDQSRNLVDLCERWSKIQEKEETQEELQGAIRSTIGQAKLLLSQRFKQFSALIDDCQHQVGQRKTRLNDLLGFWDMIYFQVEDVLRKFKSLEESIKVCE